MVVVCWHSVLHSLMSFRCKVVKVNGACMHHLADGVQVAAICVQVAAPISPHSGFDAAVTRTDTSTAGHQADAVQHTTSTFSSWIAARSREASPTRVAASHQASPLSPSRPMSTIRSVLMSSPTRSSSAPLDSQALEQQSQLASALARVNDLSAELSAADAAARQRTNEALAAQAAAEAEAQARHAVLQARQVELAEARAALAAAAREQAAQAKALRVAKAEAAELRQQLATARAEARSAGRMSGWCCSLCTDAQHTFSCNEAAAT
jgi:hypothetical protein